MNPIVVAQFIWYCLILIIWNIVGLPFKLLMMFILITLGENVKDTIKEWWVSIP